MNAKYASKPNFNPNEPDLSRQVVPNPFMGERPADPGQACPRAGGEPTTCRLHDYSPFTIDYSLAPAQREGVVLLLLFSIENRQSSIVNGQNEPNFFKTKYALSVSKTRKWMLETDPKKRNEPNLNKSLIFSPAHLSPVRLSRPQGRVDNFQHPADVSRHSFSDGGSFSEGEFAWF
jgi:hypothetical protein